jgi:hypothetical protein
LIEFTKAIAFRVKRGKIPAMNAPIEPSENVSPQERYRLFRDRIEHEDNLIMQRLSWLMASQSFLFTAYAIVTNGLSGATPDIKNKYVSHLSTLESIVPIVAMLNSLLIFISILAALRAIAELRHRYQQPAAAFNVLPLQTSRAARTGGLSAPVLLPLLFLSVWLYLLVVR